MVADIKELEKMDAPEIHARRLNVKEEISLQFGENFVFPVAGGKVKLVKILCSQSQMKKYSYLEEIRF